MNFYSLPTYHRDARRLTVRSSDAPQSRGILDKMGSRRLRRLRRFTFDTINVIRFRQNLAGMSVSMASDE
jgi:hypothetical protein